MEALQEIYILNKRLKLAHSLNGFKTSLDSVLLAASCPAEAGHNILDMGCGVGGAGFCVLARVKEAFLTGVDVQKESIDLAGYNAQANLFKGRSHFIHLDIRDFKAERSFDHIICNPPYLESGKHLRSPHTEKAIAMGHDESDMSIEDWVKAAHRNMKSNGTLTMIHRADMADKIIQALGKKFGAVEIFPLWPRHNENAKRFIIRVIKDRKSPAILHRGLILHQDNGDYTQEADMILRHMQILF